MANNKSNNKQKTNKVWAVVGCIAIVAVVIAIIAAIVINNSGIQDSYFKSDDTKYVLTVETDENSVDENMRQYTPIKMHVVYNYEGDKITGLKYYYEYADNNTAKPAADYFQQNSGDEIEAITVDGKYVVITVKASQYEGVTASDVKKQLDFIESMKQSNSNGGGTTTETTTEETTTTDGTTTETTTQTTEQTTENK